MAIPAPCSTAFFTALIYAVLGQRFSRQRSAAVAALAIGLALSTGLVWWEADHGFSIRSLGPLAVGFAVLLLASVMYRALREIGGSLSAIMLSLALSLLIGWVVGIPSLVRAEVLQTITTVALLVGILALISHRHARHDWFPKGLHTVPTVRNDLRTLYRDRHLADRLAHNLRHVRREAGYLHESPQARHDVMLQLQRMLPAEGYLTERLARLREHAYHLRHGQCARIDEIRAVIAKLPPEAKRKISEELIARYKALTLDLRLERLDRAAAEIERRIRDLTRKAQQCLARNDYRKVVDILAAATKLQKHNARLFKIIERTETKLQAATTSVAKNIPEATQG